MTAEELIGAFHYWNRVNAKTSKIARLWEGIIKFNVISKEKHKDYVLKTSSQWKLLDNENISQEKY